MAHQFQIDIDALAAQDGTFAAGEGPDFASRPTLRHRMARQIELVDDVMEEVDLTATGASPCGFQSKILRSEVDRLSRHSSFF